MIRDPFYRDIVARLNDRDSRIDPETFERCAADLLRSIYPGLVPVRGGSDAGMDGAIADGRKSPLPLICTTSDQLTRNLRGSLRSYLSNGGRRRRAVFATSRPLTPNRRANLFKAAKDEGFLLVQVHDQAGFADLLYRSPAWCRELLNLTGEPPALSAVPLTSRPLLGDGIVGRDRELRWLSEEREDVLLVGQPGSGKTHILRALAKLGKGLFVVSEDRGELAAAIRGQEPTTIFVDDAHHRLDLLLRLKHLRDEIGAEFRLLATCWPGEQLEVARTLGLTKSAVRELELLTRKEIAQIIRGCGIVGPAPLLRELLNQAKGRPGLAVTLCYLCLRDGTQDLATGRSLFEDVRQTFQQLVGREAVEILAGFAVGGSEGMPMQAVAAALGLRLLDLRHSVERLAAGGVLTEIHGQLLTVEPEALRDSLVSTVFFAGAWSLPIQNLLVSVPSPGAAAATLIGAKARGGQVPDDTIRLLMVTCRDASIWRQYASLGAEETRWVLRARPDLLSSVSWIALTTVPDTAVPQLLQQSVGDERPRHSPTDHSLRLLHDWVKDGYPGTGEAVERRSALLDGVLAWHATGTADPAVCLRAMAMVFEPSFEDHETDPVDGSTFTFRYGGLLPEEISAIRLLWPKASPLLRACGIADWTPLRELIYDWANPGMSTRGHIAPESYEEMYAFAHQVMKDVAEVAGDQLAIQSWLVDLARRKGWEVPCEVDPLYEILFPEHDHDDIQEGHRRQSAAATALAESWAADSPAEVAQRLVRYSAMATAAGHQWPMFADHVARHLASVVPEPVVWARTMIDAGAAYGLVGPFVQAVVRKRSPGWELLWQECLELAHLRGMAILVLLSEAAVPEVLLDQALEDVTGLSDAISTACLRREVPEDRLLRLLNHPDPALGERVAWALWHREPEGNVPEDLLDNWRRIVVEQMEVDYTLKAIFASDASIAFDWLARRVGQCNRAERAWDEDEPYATAIKRLTKEQRQHLLGLLRRETYPHEIVSLLVGRDTDLYQLVLERPDLRFHHLEPLHGDPDEAWFPLARMALSAGFSPAEVAGATRGRVWGWEGRESDMWRRWVDTFQPLTSSPDPSMRLIGDAAVEAAEEGLQRALSAERAEAVHGR